MKRDHSFTNQNPEVPFKQSNLNELKEKENPHLLRVSSDISVKTTDNSLHNLSEEKCCFTWPSAIALSKYLCSHPCTVEGKRIVELGCGTGVPSVVAIKLGAQHVILTDTNISYATKTQQLNTMDSNKFKCVAYNWGLLSPLLHEFGVVDVIMSADCFYESYSFEAIIKTVAYLLHLNCGATFIFSVPIRDDLKTIRWILKEYGLSGTELEQIYEHCCEIVIYEVKNSI